MNAINQIFGRRLRGGLLGALMLLAAFAVGSACGGVVINEIMYHPPHDREGLQYIELFNAGTNAADLGGWRFSKGVKFAFTNGMSLAPGGFLVVCRKREDFIERYGDKIPLAGEFEGKLSHGGERIELQDSSKRTVDSLTYSDRAPWPLAADGGSSSLERICPFVSGDDAANWASSKLPNIIAPAGTPGKTNDSFSASLPPTMARCNLIPEAPKPDEPVKVRAALRDGSGPATLTLHWRVLSTRVASEESSVLMRHAGGVEYEATLPAQPEGRLLRYRIHAVDARGAARWLPAENDLRPAFNFGTFVNTNVSKIPFFFLMHPATDGKVFQGRQVGRMNLTPARGPALLVVMPGGGGAVEIFDFVHTPQRSGGFKVHFLKDQPWRGHTGINVLFEKSRSTLSEPLAYELYRMCGVPAPLTEHACVWVDGKPLGYHLVLEQPNKSFLRRNQRDDSGTLYKLLWYGGGIEGKHEKKTRTDEGHGDLLTLLDGLNKFEGAAQWEFIQKQFNVEEFINYFAVNMCIQNWDGFFNNYYAYHDSGGTKLWEIYPWDEDKTWGDYDGASSKYDWYEMPLVFGMNGGRPDGTWRTGRSRSHFGVNMWWRDPGFFSGPMLANPEFRKRFLARLREICETIFTPGKMNPLIDSLEAKLAEEVPVRAKAHRADADAALRTFRDEIQSFRNQVLNRRQYILRELDREAAAAKPAR